MKSNYLKNRWLENHSLNLNKKKILQIIEEGGILNKEFTPFGVTSEGLADYRGIDLGEVEIKNVRIENADFSSSSFKSSRIENSVFEKVFFKNVDFEDMLENNNLFSNTKFMNCRLTKAGIGYGGTNFSACIFNNTNFLKSVFIRGEFTNCKFIDCNLRGVDFNGSSFDDCSFSGKLLDIWFRGEYALKSEVKEFGKNKKNKMFNVSFEEAILEGVNFSNDCDLSTILLPKSGSYQLYDNWKCRLENLKSVSLNLDTNIRGECEIFVKSYLVHAKNQDWFLINIAELQKEFGHDLTNIFLNGLNKLVY
jgi:fluoroquinolone resistance protein